MFGAVQFGFRSIKEMMWVMVAGDSQASKN
jgi:hypothetical protein